MQGGNRFEDFLNVAWVFQNNFFRLLFDEEQRFIFEVFIFQNDTAAFINNVAVRVHHGVVFHQMFADVEVVAFHFLLGAFNAAADEGVFNGHVIGEAEFFHEALHAFAAENAHEVVFHGNIKLRHTGVALTSGASAKLVVDAARFVSFAANHHEAAEFLHSFAEFNIGSAAGHVGGYGHGAALARFGNDFRFLFVEFGVQNVMGNAFRIEHLRKRFRFFHGHRSHQNRLAFFVQAFHRSGDGGEFSKTVFINHVGFVHARNWAMRRDFQNIEPVNRSEFFFFGFGRSRHSSQFFVNAEIVLEGDGCQRAAFFFDGQSFFRFNGLM